jgi:REP element-mobilizing transposase RayT
MSHTFTTLHFHIIFSTKDRRPLITTDLRPRLHAYLGGIVRELRGTAAAINGTSDHVHMLVELPAEVALADCMRVVKTNSSRWVHRTSPGRKTFAWQTGYAAFTVSTSNLARVADYIRNQEQHHRKVSFQEEFVAFLRRNGVPFDPAKIWK